MNEKKTFIKKTLIVVGMALILIAFVITVFIFGEGCTDYDTYKVGRTNMTVCDDD